MEDANGCIFLLAADPFAISKAVIKPDVGVTSAEGYRDIYRSHY